MSNVVKPIQAEISEATLKDIYVKISIPPEKDYDEQESIDFLTKTLEECFNEKFLKINSKLLLNDVNLLNVSFVQFVKACAVSDFKNIGKCLISYCDYFNIDYNASYVLMHDKLKLMIIASYKGMVGADTYKKILNKINAENSNGETQKTLFEL